MTRLPIKEWDLLLPFRQVDNAAREDEVVSAHNRDDSRDRPFVLAGAHGDELAACRWLPCADVHAFAEKIVMIKLTSFGYGFVVTM